MLALVFALFLFAQAGVPLTSGFFAKFYVITAAVDAGSTWLAIIAMLSSVIAAFLYLRIIVSMYMEDDGDREARHIPIPFSAGLALGVAWSSRSPSACSRAFSPGLPATPPPSLVVEAAPTPAALDPGALPAP